MTGTKRSPDQIRADMDANIRALNGAVERLRGQVSEATDWRKQVEAHKQELIRAAVVGVVLVGLLSRRRRRRRR